jgi:hypothetical protein
VNVVLNIREKIIAATLGGVILLFAADRYALSPYLEERSRVSNESDVAVTRLESAERLLTNRRKVEQAWRDLQDAGLRSDPAASESIALHSIGDWAQRSRLALQTLKTDRAIRSGDFQQIRLQVSGTGATAGLAEFLNTLETSKLPLRINEFRVNSRKEGTEDLAFNMTVSTLAYSPLPETKKPRPAAGGTRK